MSSRRPQRRPPGQPPWGGRVPESASECVTMLPTPAAYGKHVCGRAARPRRGRDCRTYGARLIAPRRPWPDGRSTSPALRMTPPKVPGVEGQNRHAPEHDAESTRVMVCKERIHCDRRRKQRDRDDGRTSVALLSRDSDQPERQQKPDESGRQENPRPEIGVDGGAQEDRTDRRHEAARHCERIFNACHLFLGVGASYRGVWPPAKRSQSSQ